MATDRPLTAGQLLYLTDLLRETCPGLRYTGRSEAGGLATIAYSLARRGLVELTGPGAPRLTDAGALAAGGPLWMYGYRCHGYWAGGRRVGYVGLPARQGGGGVKKYGYDWGVTMTGSGITQAEGTEPTLRRAKRKVEETYRALAAAAG